MVSGKINIEFCFPFDDLSSNQWNWPNLRHKFLTQRVHPVGFATVRSKVLLSVISKFCFLLIIIIVI